MNNPPSKLNIISEHGMYGILGRNDPWDTHNNEFSALYPNKEEPKMNEKIESAITLKLEEIESISRLYNERVKTLKLDLLSLGVPESDIDFLVAAYMSQSGEQYEDIIRDSWVIVIGTGSCRG